MSLYCNFKKEILFFKPWIKEKLLVYGYKDQDPELYILKFFDRCLFPLLWSFYKTIRWPFAKIFL